MGRWGGTGAFIEGVGGGRRGGGVQNERKAGG